GGDGAEREDEAVRGRGDEQRLRRPLVPGSAVLRRRRGPQGGKASRLDEDAPLGSGPRVHVVAVWVGFHTRQHAIWAGPNGATPREAGAAQGRTAVGAASAPDERAAEEAGADRGGTGFDREGGRCVALVQRAPHAPPSNTTRANAAGEAEKEHHERAGDCGGE